eukprot:TRINITY_DN124_c0_g1_i2.p1 TRINITY_DN124_c0_g1~~TRINITY_DN124_c0_g1_i2.p1  ORF type:complete len:581 (+),score=88.59 TRINITY_DN124_c0_g1_i2:137-1879(+)
MCVVHRDLKPENLLLDDRKDIKIVDFGLSNTYKEGDLLQTACGSPCYAAPEMISGHRYKPCMVDIWSCGVILFALVCGCLPFESNEEDQNHTELYKKILNAEYEVPDDISREVADLIGGMLTTDPTKRLTLEGIRQHVWYRQIPEASIRYTEDRGVLDEDILEQLGSYGFPREYAKKCLESNKHNHVTTTYYLLKEKRHLAKAATVGATPTELAIAALDATGRGEDTLPPPLALPPPRSSETAAAVAAVATPSRGQRLEADSGPAVAANGGWYSARGPAPVRGERPRPASAGPTGRHIPQDVPRLNLGALGGAGQDPTATGTAATPNHRGAASPHSARASGSAATPRGASCGPCARPASARGHAPSYTAPGSRRRPPSADHRARGAGGGAPYGEPLAGPAWTPWIAEAEAEEYAARRFALGPDGEAAPLTARSRLQGNAVGPGGFAGRPPGAPAASWGLGPPLGRTRPGSTPHSARGGSGHAAEGMRMPPQDGTCQVSCHTSLTASAAINEVLHALAANRIAFRHTSGFAVRCQAGGVCFEAEILQASRGRRFMLRFSRVAGDVSQYKDICERLLGEMSL